MSGSSPPTPTSASPAPTTAAMAARRSPWMSARRPCGPATPRPSAPGPATSTTAPRRRRPSPRHPPARPPLAPQKAADDGVVVAEAFADDAFAFEAEVVEEGAGGGGFLRRDGGEALASQLVERVGHDLADQAAGEPARALARKARFDVAEAGLVVVEDHAAQGAAVLGRHADRRAGAEVARALHLRNPRRHPGRDGFGLVED